MKELSLSEKYVLTVSEAALYFGLGQKKVRQLAQEHTGSFSVRNGNRYLIIRTKMEDFLANTSTI